jgi:hypothetical protein
LKNGACYDQKDTHKSVNSLLNNDHFYDFKRRRLCAIE